MSIRTIYLTPPLLSPSHIKEKISCIRSHRERLFRVEAELQNEKLICHNYGQSGAGWTFLFGCVNESVRQFEQSLQENPQLKNEPICIVGAGCYGLLTATTLARKGYTVRIVAKETDNLPSHTAAGFFFPRPRKTSADYENAIFLSHGIESYREYLRIVSGTHPFIQQGATLLPAYYGLDMDPGFALYIEQGLINEAEHVIIDFGNGKAYPALAYQTIFMNATLLMQELQRTIAELNIPIIKQEIATFEDIEEKIIFNCTGLGAKKLTHDKRLAFVQGHLISLQNQPDRSQLQYMINVKVIMTDAQGNDRYELIYFTPKQDGILGITFIRGPRALQENAHEFDRLLERCHAFFGNACADNASAI